MCNQISKTLLILSLILNGCSYGTPINKSRIINVLRVPNSRVIAILVKRTTLKSPEGLAKFPDGGKPKILGIESSIYLFDIDKKELHTLLVFQNLPNQLIGFEPWLKGWHGQDLYFKTTGCPSTREVDIHGCGESKITTKYFKVNGQGVSQPVEMIPTVLNQGRNSPLVATPDEFNYTRISSDYNSIDVTTTDSNNFHRILELDDQGNLKQIE